MCMLHQGPEWQPSRSSASAFSSSPCIGLCMCRDFATAEWTLQRYAKRQHITQKGDAGSMECVESSVCVLQVPYRLLKAFSQGAAAADARAGDTACTRNHKQSIGSSFVHRLTAVLPCCRCRTGC